jgi:hypothetical protein
VLKTLLNILLFLLLPVAFVSARQEITFQNITLQKVTQNSVACLAIQCDVVLSETYNQRIQAGDSNEVYYIEVWLKDSTNYIRSAKGYGTLTDSIGRLKIRTPLYLVYDAKMYGAFTVYVPFAALQIPTGLQKIKPVIKVVDKAGKILVPGFGATYNEVEVPAKVDLRLTVKRIEVSEKDNKGENWDYHLVHCEGVKPEVYWAIKFGGRQLSRSPYEVNSLTYADDEGRYTFEFSISEGDIFYLDVNDFDVTSFSDKIGSYKIDMKELAMLSGASINIKFDKVERMDFVLTIL